MTIKEEIEKSFEMVARTAHEVNRIYCASIGDFSQEHWKDAPEWQKQSAINGVKFHIENPESGPEGSHVNWMKEKEENGWKYGVNKSEVLKTHPRFIPYAELPEKQQLKDLFFTTIVKELTR